MALFASKKEKKSAAPKKTGAGAAPEAAGRPALPAAAPALAAAGLVLLRPRVTEKSSFLSERGVYVFEVAADAGKREVAAAVAALYKVHPVRITFLPVPEKRVFIRGRAGRKRGSRKAYVFLKKGEKIEVI